MRILIIAYYFPPRNTIASHRPYAWARAWSEQGHEVLVAAPEERSGDLSLSKDCESFRTVRIPRSRFHEWVIQTAKKPVRPAVRIRLHRRPGIHRIRQWLKQTGAFREMRMPSFADLWTRRCYRTLANVRAQAGRTPWDVVISTANPYAVHVIARKLKKKGYARAFLADYRDLWTDNPVFKGLPVFRIAERIREKKILSRVDAVLTVSESLAENLKTKTSAPVFVSYNGYDEDSSTPGAYSGFPAGRQVLLYTGSLYRSHRDPEPLLRSLRQWVDTHQENAQNVHLAFAGHNVDHLPDLIQQYDLRDYVKYYGALSFEVSQAMQNTANALLFIESSLPEAEGYVTGKLFEYLQKARPIVAMGITERAESWKIMRSHGTAQLVRSNEDFFGMFETLAAGAWEQESERQLPPQQFNRRVLAEQLLQDLQNKIPALSHKQDS